MEDCTSTFWPNVSQLFYFPLLVYAFLHAKEHFVFFYIVITGAHFFLLVGYIKHRGMPWLQGYLLQVRL